MAIRSTSLSRWKPSRRWLASDGFVGVMVVFGLANLEISAVGWKTIEVGFSHIHLLMDANCLEERISGRVRDGGEGFRGGSR
jgi:hypothetical protein